MPRSHATSISSRLSDSQVVSPSSLSPLLWRAIGGGTAVLAAAVHSEAFEITHENVLCFMDFLHPSSLLSLSLFPFLLLSPDLPVPCPHA